MIVERREVMGKSFEGIFATYFGVHISFSTDCFTLQFGYVVLRYEGLSEKSGSVRGIHIVLHVVLDYKYERKL